MDALYYKFDFFTEYSNYYLVKESEIKSYSSTIRFKLAFTDVLCKSTVYRQILTTYKYPDYATVREDIINLEVIKYDHLLKVCNWVKGVNYIYEEIICDLDLILINWDVS